MGGADKVVDQIMPDLGGHSRHKGPNSYWGPKGEDSPEPRLWRSWRICGEIKLRGKAGHLLRCEGEEGTLGNRVVHGVRQPRTPRGRGGEPSVILRGRGKKKVLLIRLKPWGKTSSQVPRRGKQAEKQAIAGEEPKNWERR